MSLAMLYYGSERVVADIPEINMNVGTGTIIHLECNAGDCKWYADAMDPEEADEFADEHQRWHEEGMPQ